MPLSFKKQPLNRYLINNPIVIGLITNLQERVEMEFSPFGYSNLLNPDAFTLNTRLSASSGELYDDSNYDTSDFMEIEDGVLYNFLCEESPVQGTVNLVTYTADKEYVDGASYVPLGIAKVAGTLEAKYVRVSFRKDVPGYNRFKCGLFKENSLYVPYGNRYRGVYLPAGISPGFEINISVSEIAKPYLSDCSLLNKNDLLSAAGFNFLPSEALFTQENDAVSCKFDIYNGGISKCFLRYLLEQDADIFTYKLLNPYKQFLLTTRTAGRHITIREKELCPLYFIALNKSYTVVTEHNRPFDLTPLTQYNVYALNLEYIRKYCFETFDEWPSVFKIKVNNYVVFDITVIPSANIPDIYAIEFKNSFGIPERLEVSGKKVSEPEFADDNVFDLFDATVDDYIERNERLPLREVINAEFGYKTRDEFLFSRDMLQSDKRYLIDSSGTQHEIRVKSEGFSHDLHPVVPGSVPLEIRLVDSETEFSPVPDISYKIKFEGNGGLTLSGETSVTVSVSPGTEWRHIDFPEFKQVDTERVNKGFTAVQNDRNTLITDDTVIYSNMTVYAKYPVAIFVAVRNQASMEFQAAYSYNGSDWLPATLPRKLQWIAVAYGNDRFVALPEGSSYAAYSDNGIDWEDTSLSISLYWSSIAFGKGRFVAVCLTGSTTGYSNDGISWTYRYIMLSGWVSVTYGNNRFVATPYNRNQAAYSDDGVDWLYSTLPDTGYWMGLAFGNGRFITCSTKGKIAYSDDGANWLPATTPNTTALRTAAFGNGRFVALSQNADIALYSDNGINWQSTTIPNELSALWMSVTFGDGKFVAVNSSGKIACSDDGVNWVSATVPDETGLASVTCGIVE